ncbi:universal stress protein [Nocardioides sp. AN3]
MTDRLRITVGIDGSDGSKAAAIWAANEARRVGADLRLLHVFTDYAPTIGYFASPGSPGSMEGHRMAEKLVRESARGLESSAGEIRVEPLVLRGDRRAGLLRAAADSALLVLGDEPHPVHHRLITGSIIGGVAGHAACPVVVVPAGTERRPALGVIVAGVKIVSASHDLVRQAFELAADRGSRLVILHAWESPSPYDDLLSSRLDVPGWEERSVKELDQIVDEVSADFTNVTAEVRIVHGQPARALIDASAEADLLAITRRLHGFPLGHLGAAGRAVLRETRAPAIVLPPALHEIPLSEPVEAPTR